MAEEKVRQALALLEQARRMDLVRPEALGPLHPAQSIGGGSGGGYGVFTTAYKQDGITEDVQEEGLREGPQGEESAEESPFEVGAVPEEVVMAEQPAEVEVRKKRGAQAQKKDPMVPI
ncbi:hypothetical protein NDU88_004341 [Pleurodeles waltl]|uniref:Uncharacterized protein n=1 Tax=Pleurodeles waltl TaxID=8319 RepID=A0AAV7W802_PLEWA|nr:hypothetical protein NDU88_004341 [Pleurodeles waltl]